MIKIMILDDYEWSVCNVKVDLPALNNATESENISELCSFLDNTCDSGIVI